MESDFDLEFLNEVMNIFENNDMKQLLVTILILVLISVNGV